MVGMRNSIPVINEAQEEFAKQFGRSYGMTEEYMTGDAEVIVIAMGTIGKEMEVAVDVLRKEGVKAGSLRVRWFRPFPDLREKLEGKEIVVIDRDYSFGLGGILANELRAKTCCDPYSVIAGLGGQDVTYDDIAGFVRDGKAGEEFWFGVSE
jgi:pyruvate ferredoxin oxidoreductase alpha subunit